MKKLTEKQLNALKLGRVKGIKKPGAGFKKGHAPWNRNKKGIHLSPESEWKKGYTPQGSVLFYKGQIPWNKGEINSDNVFLQNKLNEYKALHKRIGRRFKKKGKCQFCGAVKQTEWANKDNQYLEVRENWLELCKKCHVNYDKNRYHRINNNTLV